MSSALKWDLISEVDYLASEANSDTKNEYREGVIYAMAGGKVIHNRIASNATITLGGQLKGKPCSVFNSDMKIRIERPRDLRFYYPDASVICDSNPPQDSFQEKPKVIIEVVSESTRRIDEGEKREAYTSIESLDVYLLAEIDEPTVQIWRRKNDASFDRSVISGLDQVIDLAEIGAKLPLSELFEGVEFE